MKTFLIILTLLVTIYILCMVAFFYVGITVKYTIKRGKKYCNIPFLIVLGNGFKAEVELISDPDYTLSDDQEDTNKLFRLSDSYHHHRWSYGIGWRSDGNKTNIRYMGYENSERILKDISEKVDKGSKFTTETNKVNGNIISTFENKNISQTHIEDFPHRWIPLRVLFMPQFGGNKSAPKDIKLKAKLKLKF